MHPLPHVTPHRRRLARPTRARRRAGAGHPPAARPAPRRLAAHGPNRRPALTGAEIELLDDAALREVGDAVDVFARASPEHQIRLVQALQSRGEVVAMTGDGVNPALKRADVGVAMGRNGTEAAKGCWATRRR